MGRGRWYFRSSSISAELELALLERAQNASSSWIGLPARSQGLRCMLHWQFSGNRLSGEIAWRAGLVGGCGALECRWRTWRSQSGTQGPVQLLVVVTANISLGTAGGCVDRQRRIRWVGRSLRRNQLGHVFQNWFRPAEPGQSLFQFGSQRSLGVYEGDRVLQRD